MYYPNLNKYKNLDNSTIKSQGWNEKIDDFDSYLDMKSKKFKKNQRIFYIDFVSQKLNVTEEEALLLLSIAFSEGILLPKYTIWSIDGLQILDELINPDSLPDVLFDQRNNEPVNREEYKVVLKFIFNDKASQTTNPKLNILAIA